MYTVTAESTDERFMLSNFVGVTSCDLNFRSRELEKEPNKKGQILIRIETVKKILAVSELTIEHIYFG